MTKENIKTDSNTLYRKLPNGRYKAVASYEPEVWDSLPFGTHLVLVEPGFRTRVWNVNPDYAALEAAAAILRNELSQIIAKATSLRPLGEKLTAEQRELWDKLSDTGIGAIGYASAYNAAAEISDFICNQAKASHAENPWIKELQEQYQAAMILAGRKETK